MDRREGAVAIAVLGLLAQTACGGRAAGDAAMEVGGSSGGGGAGLGSGGDLGAGGQAEALCEAEAELTVAEGTVAVEVRNEAPPAPVGGPLVDGVYDLMSYVVYGDVPYDSSDFDFDLRQAIRVREGGTVMDIARPGSGFDSASIAPRAPGATSLELTTVCSPHSGSETVEYSAPPGQLVIYTGGPDVFALATHTQRP